MSDNNNLDNNDLNNDESHRTSHNSNAENVFGKVRFEKEVEKKDFEEDSLNSSHSIFYALMGFGVIVVLFISLSGFFQIASESLLFIYLELLFVLFFLAISNLLHKIYSHNKKYKFIDNLQTSFLSASSYPAVSDAEYTTFRRDTAFKFPRKLVKDYVMTVNDIQSRIQFSSYEENVKNDIRHRVLNLKNVSFNFIDLKEINFKRVIMHRAVFFSCNLWYSNFNNSEGIGCSFEASFLSYSNFINADLKNANFRTSILEESKLENAIIIGSNFEKANLIKANLKSSKGSATNFTDAIMKHSNLSDSIFSDSNFSFADLSGSIIKNTDFTNTNLYGVNLRGSYLLGCIFEGVDLGESNIDARNISHIEKYKESILGYNTIVWISEDDFFTENDGDI